MLDRIHWSEKSEKAIGLKTKLNIPLDLAQHAPGERHPFEEMMRTLYPGGWTRQQAVYVARQAIAAVSRAIVKDGRGAFPLEAKMITGQSLEDRPPNVLTIDFRRTV